MQRKIDVVRVRKGYLPKGEKADKALKELVAALKGKNTEIDDSKESLIIWENVEE